LCKEKPLAWVRGQIRHCPRLKTGGGLKGAEGDSIDKEGRANKVQYRDECRERSPPKGRLLPLEGKNILGLMAVLENPTTRNVTS
jgi:hypothetical protein